MPYKSFGPGMFTAADVDQYLMSQASIICTSTTRPPGLRVGMRIWETDLQCERIWDGTEWTFLRGLGIFMLKTSDQSLTSNTSLTDDTQLQGNVLATAKYVMECHIISSSPSAADIRFTFNGPAGCSIDWVPYFPHINQTNGDQVQISFAHFSAAGTADGAGIGASGQNVVYQPRGLVMSTGTSGTFKFRWCQLVSNATATVVRSGSWIYLRRVQ